jgi:hypothetical protein
MSGGASLLLAPATTTITVTAASGSGATLTIPAASAGLFNYLCLLAIYQCQTATAVGVTTVVVTTTGITGTPSIDFGSDYLVGRGDKREWFCGGSPLKGSAAATAMTVVCPATTNVLWRVSATYFVAP